MFRIAHALGFPVVPDVYIKTARSFGVRFAAGRPIGENCCSVSNVRSSTEPVSGVPKDEMFNVRWGKSTQTSCDKSAVEIMDLEPDTLRQWVKVSSVWWVRNSRLPYRTQGAHLVGWC